MIVLNRVGRTAPAVETGYIYSEYRCVGRIAIAELMSQMENNSW